MWRGRLKTLIALVQLPGAILWALVVLVSALRADDQAIEE
jgi:hypothetical protein